MKNLWIPNIFIYNLKSFRTIDVLSKLAGLWIDSNKRIYYRWLNQINITLNDQITIKMINTVFYFCEMIVKNFGNFYKRIYYSQATHITFICPMVFDAFPLDTQICKFQVKCFIECNPANRTGRKYNLKVIKNLSSGG